MVHQVASDYQHFDFDEHGGLTNVGERMRLKLRAVPIPDLRGHRVLDVRLGTSMHDRLYIIVPTAARLRAITVPNNERTALPPAAAPISKSAAP